MGQNISFTQNFSDNNKSNLKDFKKLSLIGKGGYGKVYLVKNIKDNKLYALKELSKRKVLFKNSINSLNTEFEILKNINHKFIVDLCYAFDDKENVYFILEYLPGGDLRYQIEKNEFSEEQAKFLICCIITSLDVWHKNEYIYKDLKPENLIFDEKGYLKLADFGVSKKWNFKNNNEIKGTPSYMAPEILCKRNHTYSSDFYSLGIILYELIHGKRPYEGSSMRDIKEQVLSNNISIKSHPKWSKESIDFCNKLLKRNVSKRLGNYGIVELKNHKWLKSTNWESILDKTLESPFIPIKININSSIDMIEENSIFKRLNKSRKYKLDNKSKKILKTIKFNYKNEKLDNNDLDTKSS